MFVRQAKYTGIRAKTCIAEHATDHAMLCVHCTGYVNQAWTQSPFNRIHLKTHKESDAEFTAKRKNVELVVCGVLFYLRYSPYSYSETPESLSCVFLFAYIKFNQRTWCICNVYVHVQCKTKKRKKLIVDYAEHSIRINIDVDVIYSNAI